MMYSKLAFRNIRRSLRDYIIYFVTLTLTAALMYSFLALGFSPDILAVPVIFLDMFQLQYFFHSNITSASYCKIV